MTQFHALLDSKPSESAVQDFLERHPSLVPGAWTPGTKSGHPPFCNVLITQPKLPGFEARIPDFLWISRHSGSMYAAMVEIERPSKTLFTSAPVPTAEFTQAYNQFAQWRIWFDWPANQQLFYDHYGITPKQLFSLDFDLHFILVFGRRSEFESKPKLSKLRGKLANGRNEELISFDRLSPDRWLDCAVTVTPAGGGRFTVKYVPETFTTSPHGAHDLLVLDGLEAAIDSNDDITPDRRAFLKQRVAYWCKWAKEKSSCFIAGSAYSE
ncbi:DUF4263 domain-containing protein [Aureliella helgolandensis]|uniref:DUF4263 domain-containing protein n=1 Tax=Aureliella helgolandensis TaxID=2527968 RepID=UPI0021BCA95F|nr:DUF4263 domain-containing protein [Aureliella helgolandensis]